jgi:hypothetical protein
VDEIIFVSPF